MKFTHGLRASSRLRIRRGAPRTLTIATTALVFALVASAGSWLPAAAPVGAQTVATARPSVTVHGSGEATAPAVTATVQLLIGQGGREFGFSEDGSGGSSFESGGAVSASGGGFEVTVMAEATPEASAAGVDEAAATPVARGGRRDRSGPRERMGPEPITAERLAPIVDAVATGAGIERAAVTVDLSPLATEPFGGRPESARLDFEIARPDPAALAEMIAAASDAAAANGMVIEIAGVRYNPADCAVVEAEATTAAIEDARAQAGRLAELLEVTLGGVIGASTDLYFFGSFGPGDEVAGCSGQQSSVYDSSYGGLGITVPIFDPSEPAEVEVYAVLTISFEILESEGD